MRKKIIIIALVAAGLGLAAFLTYSRMHAPAANRILVSGNIELDAGEHRFQDRRAAGGARRWTKATRCSKGQVIARLDRDQLERQREAQVAALAAAQAQLAQSRTGDRVAARDASGGSRAAQRRPRRQRRRGCRN